MNFKIFKYTLDLFLVIDAKFYNVKVIMVILDADFEQVLDDKKKLQLNMCSNLVTNE